MGDVAKFEYECFALYVEAYGQLPEFNDKNEFLHALTKSKIFGHRSSLLVHLNSTWARLKKHL